MCQEMSMVMATEAYEINKSKTGHPVLFVYRIKMVIESDVIFLQAKFSFSLNNHCIMGIGDMNTIHLVIFEVEKLN